MISPLGDTTVIGMFSGAGAGPNLFCPSYLGDMAETITFVTGIPKNKAKQKKSLSMW